MQYKITARYKIYL